MWSPVARAMRAIAWGSRPSPTEVTSTRPCPPAARYIRASSIAVPSLSSTRLSRLEAQLNWIQWKISSETGRRASSRSAGSAGSWNVTPRWSHMRCSWLSVTPSDSGGIGPSTVWITSAMSARSPSRLRAAGPHPDPQARIEDVPEGVAEQIEGDDQQHERQRRKDHQPWGDGHEAARGGQHVAPIGVRRLDAEPEKAQRRLRDFRGGQAERGLHDHRWDGGGEDVAHDDARGRGAGR